MLLVRTLSPKPMRDRPYAFLRIGDRWINMAMVTDIEDHGDELVVFMSADMAQLAGRDSPNPIDVARRYIVADPAAVEKLRVWLRLNDEE